MAEVHETHLPGVGVRHEFTSSAGERIALVTHRSGRRELVLHDRDDPDACRAVVHLSPDDTRTLGELLGTSQVSEAVLAAQRIEGLALDWIPVPEGSACGGASIGAGQFRSRTGASVVAVIRGSATIPAPDPSTTLEHGDVLVAVGTPDGLTRLRSLLAT